MSLILYPLMAIYGAFVTWPPADEILNKYQNDYPVLVGGTYNHNNNNGVETKTKSRSYILVPSVINDKYIISITTKDNGKAEVHKSKNGLIYLLSWYLLCLFGTWWFWFRTKEKISSNKSLQSDV